MRWDRRKIYVDDVDDSQTAIENGTVIIITTTINTKVGLDTTSAAHYFNNLNVPLSFVIVSDDLAVNAV